MDSKKISEPPELQVEGYLARIRLRRPGHANRLETQDLDVLLDICGRLAADNAVRAVVLESEGRHFSAGFDIRRVAEIASATPDGPVHNPFEAVVEAIERLPQPTIARLHGGVYGGSTDLALARTEARRVGTEVVSKERYRWERVSINKNTNRAHETDI